MANYRQTFFNINRTLDSKGEEFCGVAAVLSLTSVRRKTVDGRTLVTARAAINGKNEIISKMIGDVPAEGDTIWTDVLFWDKGAERIAKLAEGKKSIKCAIYGSVKQRTWAHNGVEEKGISINTFSFYPIMQKRSED